ncbi:uncharacterized protein CG3556-like [Uloborus diversus]|uniref:uncharacterized protein CG3556-like n=1 Tax=Uloborus diversus TaxID=327109 RepID=UPI0024099296|nr:uncharacterized protein CG3556-like [Uloborus diversus]
MAALPVDNVTSNEEFHASFREKIFKNGPCELDEFRCLNNECIARDLHCNGIKDCSDRSDEDFCLARWASNCPTSYPFTLCDANNKQFEKCIPKAWLCDGVLDCTSGWDEKYNCSKEHFVLKPLENVNIPRRIAVDWLLGLQRNTSILKWGSKVQHIAVALHLANAKLPEVIKSELAHEVVIQFLSRLVLKKIADIPSGEIAQYVNAFLATCIDPRNFFKQDLVAELRKRVNAQKYTNPFLMLALCNAGEDITEKDAKKVYEAFKSNHKEPWTDIQAYAVMALACAAAQPRTTWDVQKIEELTMELKQKQLRNGTIDNLKTTALVMQALYAAEEEEDEANFDEEKAMRRILGKQLDDGSFGDVVNTYYVLPVLNHRSLVNISFNKCEKQKDDGNIEVNDLIDEVGPTLYVQYSLWIGDKKDLQRSLKVRVPVNTSFYGVMEKSAQLDDRYRFEFNIKDGKPYIYSLSNIQDDPENERFWFPYTFVRINGTTQLVPIQSSPVDVVPSNNQHVIYWYKTASWK